MSVRWSSAPTEQTSMRYTTSGTRHSAPVECSRIRHTDRPLLDCVRPHRRSNPVDAHPLDTLRTARQLQVRDVPHLYAGYKDNVLGDTCGTFVYFETYERCRTHFANAAAAAMFAVVVSNVVSTPFSIWTKRHQSEQNGFEVETLRLTRNTFGKVYTSSVVRKIPKSMIKYATYERLVAFYRAILPMYLCGALCAAIASIVATICCTPIDVVRTRIIFRLEWTQLFQPRNAHQLFEGVDISVLTSCLSDALGHAILESLSPRIF